VSVALGIQHAMRMRHIVLPSVDCLGLPHISTLSHKQQDFQIQKFVEHKIFDLLRFIFLTHFVFIYFAHSKDPNSVTING
jgi:hypothetical protein